MRGMSKRLRKRPVKLDVSYGLYSHQVSPVGSRYATEMAEIFGQSGYLQSILDAEAASTAAISELYPKKIPRADAKRIRAAANTGRVKPEAVQRLEAEETHHEMGAIIRELAKQSGKSGRHVHYTLTSADAVETGKALQLRRGLEKLIKTVEEVRDTCLAAALEWKDVPAIMRTHGQHAIPGSFGLPFGFFGYSLERIAERLSYDLKNFVEGKMSGVIGTYDVPADEGMEGFSIEETAMRKLGIRASEVSMQTPPRENIAYIIADIAVLGGRLEAIASYIKTLKRTEILEVREEQEEGAVSSSAMPHKNTHGNPYTEERCISIAKVLRGFAVSAMESVQSEDFRDLAASLSDRVIIPEAFVLADYSCRLIENVIGRLEMMSGNVERNLGIMGGAITSQRLMSRLISRGVSRDEARRISREAAVEAQRQKRSFADLLLTNPEVLEFVSRKEIRELSDPHTYLGKSREIIERTASRYKGRSH